MFKWNIAHKRILQTSEWVIVGQQEIFLISTKYVVKFLGLKVCPHDFLILVRVKAFLQKIVIKVLSSNGTFNN